jgi:carbon monoxide dehydrogenase subunit G
MPQRESRFSVNAPPEELWKFLRDFESLCTCIPGVERIEVLDERNAQLTVKEKVGVIPLIVDLKASIDAEEPPRRLHATAKGEHVTIAIDVSLERHAGGTELVSLFDVKGDGPLKPVVDRLFERRATERTAQFAECLAKRFSAEAPAAPAASQPGWLARLWRWLTSSS